MVTPRTRGGTAVFHFFQLMTADPGTMHWMTTFVQAMISA
jgi:hypothetical protein